MTKTLTKIALIVVVATFAACSNSGNNQYSLSPNRANLTWRGDYDVSSHRMHYIGEWAGCGWWFGDDSVRPAADFSDYDQLVVNVDSIEGDSVSLFLNVRYTTTDIITSESAPIVNGHSTLHVNLDPYGKSHILEIFVMSKNPCELNIKSATFKKATRYGKPHVIKVYDGFIDASEFEGFSDDALVSFNYFADGEMTHISDSGTIEHMDNWVIGLVSSSADVIEATCPGRRIILKQIGEQSYDCLLGDIRYMLELADDDGERGLYWVVWTGGNVTDVHIRNVTVREAKN